MARHLAEVELKNLTTVSSGLCDFFEASWPSIGFNGLIDLLQALQDGTSTPSLDAWGLRERALRLEGRADLSEWKHSLGSYAVETNLCKSPDSQAHLRSLLEIAGSLRLGGGPLHAVVRSAVSSEATADAKALWHFALERVCGMFRPLPNILAHCLHGFGHGLLAREVRQAMDFDYEGLDACTRARVGTQLVPVKEEQLQSALRVCMEAPTAQLRYICAGGVFMELWTGPRPREGICAGQPVSAACFRFQSAGMGFEEVRAALRDGGPVPEPCTLHGASLPGLVLRGCIWGMAFQLHGPYDSSRAAAAAAAGAAAAGRAETLREWCSPYEPGGRTLTAGPRRATGQPVPEQARDYGHWLSCIAGAMAKVAFTVEEWAIERPVLEDYCRQILDARGYRTCVRSGMARRAVEADGTLVWEVDILETLDIYPD